MTAVAVSQQQKPEQEQQKPEQDQVPASQLLAEQVQSQLNSPAILIPGRLVQPTMVELQDGIPISHFAPFRDFQTPFAMPFFLGASFDGNPNEHEHMHPAQHELYIPKRGEMSIRCERGDQSVSYSVGPGDVLLVPPGTWHFVEWTTPGWCYVVKGPNHLTGPSAKVTR